VTEISTPGWSLLIAVRKPSTFAGAQSVMSMVLVFMVL